jgi:hypothetical protein
VGCGGAFGPYLRASFATRRSIWRWKSVTSGPRFIAGSAAGQSSSTIQSWSSLSKLRDQPNSKMFKALQRRKRGSLGNRESSALNSSGEDRRPNNSSCVRNESTSNLLPLCIKGIGWAHNYLTTDLCGLTLRRTPRRSTRRRHFSRNLPQPGFAEEFRALCFSGCSAKAANSAIAYWCARAPAAGRTVVRCICRARVSP